MIVSLKRQPNIVTNETDIPHLQLGRFPRNASCAVTTSWDDNDTMNVEIIKILDSFKMKATFYVDPIGLNKKNNPYVDLQGNPAIYKDGLTDSQLRSLAVNHEIGSHTWSHSYLHVKSCDAKILRKEFSESKEYLENILKQPVLGIAYPYGLHTSLSERIARECGYLFARTILQGNVDFPPLNPFRWGISVAVRQWTPASLKSQISLKSILSPNQRIYLKNLTWDWRVLGVKLFEKARRTHGVLHIFSHASDILRSELRSQFLEFCRHVAFKDDVWYTTNGLLFLNEMIRNSVQIDQAHHENRSVFRVRATPILAFSMKSTPVPVRLEVPRKWRDFNVRVITSGLGRIEMGKLSNLAWIDIFDNEAEIEVSRI